MRQKCPKCKTELEGKSGFFGGYVMKCVGCGYKKRIGSYGEESERVVKLARREFERRKGL